MKWISCGAIAFLMLTGATLPSIAQPANTYMPWPSQRTGGFMLGIPEPPPATSGGVVVQDLVRNFPAARAGIRPGDIIVKINGNPISSYDEIDAYQKAGAGRPLTIDINRRGAHLRVRAAPTLTSLKGWWKHPATQQDVPIHVQPYWTLGLVYNAEGIAAIPCAEDPDCDDE